MWTVKLQLGNINHEVMLVGSPLCNIKEHVAHMIMVNAYGGTINHLIPFVFGHLDYFST